MFLLLEDKGSSEEPEALAHGLCCSEDELKEMTEL